MMTSLFPRVFFFAVGELRRIVERIEHVHVSGPLDERPTGFLKAGRHACLIPVRDGVADVIDEAGCRRPWIGRRPGIARDQELAAFARLRSEHQIGAAAVVLVRHALHAEMVDVEVAHFGVVRAAVGDMIDTEHLQAARRLRLGGIAHRVDAGGERDGLAELAAVDPAALEVSHEISNEAFHAGPPLFEAQQCYASESSATMQRTDGADTITEWESDDQLAVMSNPAARRSTCP